MHSVKANSPLPAPSSRVRRFSDLLPILRRVLAGLRTLRRAVTLFVQGAFCNKAGVTCLVRFLRLRLLFRANTTVLREAVVKIPALRESKFALARPLFAGAVL